MTEAFTAVQINDNTDKKIIHYLDTPADDITLCGASGPFEEVKIHYRDRYDNRVCKTCFKTYITYQRVESEND